MGLDEMGLDKMTLNRRQTALHYIYVYLEISRQGWSFRPGVAYES